MNRIKTVGLAIAMALTLTVLLGTASASASQFRAEEYSATLKSTQKVVHKLKTAAGTFECGTVNVVSGSSFLPSASKTLNVAPEFSKCTYLGLGVTVTTNLCYYSLTSTNEAEPFTGSMDIVCPIKPIEVKLLAAECTLKIPGQTGLGVTFANTGTRSRNRTVSFTLNATGVKYEGNCFADTGLHEDGKLTGTTEVSGATSSGSHKIGLYLANQEVASPPVFNNEGIGGTLSTEGSSARLSFPGESKECGTFELSGTQGVATDKLGLGISKWKCQWLGTFTVNPNGCSFELQPTTSEVDSELEHHIWGIASIKCPSGASLTFSEGGTCTYSIPGQTLPSATYRNLGAGATRSVEANIASSALTYTKSAGCAKPGTFSDGGLTAKFTVKGGGPIWIVD